MHIHANIAAGLDIGRRSMPIESRMRIHRVLEMATEVALQRQARHARKVHSGLRSIQIVDTNMIKLNNAGKVFQQLRM